MRWLKELLRPARKCERVGHNCTWVRRKIRRRGEGRIVVEDFNATFDICKRCGKTDGPRDEKRVDWFTGCTMPNYMWEELDQKGYVEL
jgi:hypothetical protein